MSRWREIGGECRGSEYDDRWRRLEASGQWVHGEADLVCWFKPGSVLDAGCGTGRVAIELDRRGIDAVGVDLDPRMLETARYKAPHMGWMKADLVDVELPGSGGREGRRGFDVVVLAGNVMIFLAPGTEAAAVSNMAGHLAAGGRLLAGFQLGPMSLTLADYDRFAAGAGLSLEHRWSTWERHPYEGGDYAVSAHRRMPQMG